MNRFVLVAIIGAALLVVCSPLILNAPAQEKPDHIVVAHDANYPPFSYQEGSTPKGYLIDMWKAFGDSNGIEISFMLGSWQESLDYVKTGKADVHGGLFYSEKRDQFLDYGPTIFELSTRLYKKKGIQGKIHAQYAIGVVRGGFEEAFLRKNRYREILIPFDDNRQLITAASNGKIKSFVADQPTASYYMTLFAINDQFESSEKLYTMPMRLAVANQNERLLAYLDTKWGEIDPKAVKYIHRKWFLSEPETAGWVISTTIYSSIGVCAAIALLLYFRHRNRIRS